MHTPSLWQQLPSNGRAFIRFWGGCATAAVALAIGLQVMGPPGLSIEGQDIDVSADSAAKQSSPAQRTTIPGPQADLLESKNGPGGFPLPKVGAHDRTPKKVYAAPAVDVPPGTPMVALLIDGIDQTDDLTTEAINSLPGPVSLGISPYAANPEELMNAARQHRHETLLSLPIQDNATKNTDAGPKALGLLLSPQQNMDNLNWALSHLAGYVGVTNAFAGQNGGSFPQSESFKSLVKAIDQRGLLYLDATPGTQTEGASSTATADVVVNTDTDIVNIDIQLLKLQQMARQNGRAIGILGPLRPVAMACLRAWLPHLKDMGIALVPVSQIVLPPDMSAYGPAAADGSMHVNLSNPHVQQQGQPQQ